MSKERKTVEVADLKRWANNILTTPNGEVNHITREYKDGVCTFIELALHKAKAYKGYVFVDNQDSEYGTYGYFTREYL